jgi:rhodanese-related sulfurtransferase
MFSTLLVPTLIAMAIGAAAKVPMVVDAPSAHAAATQGDTVFVDIRRPDEWVQTGMPEGSIGITMQDQDFVERVEAALGGDRGRPLVLICRSGARSGQTLMGLRQLGFTHVSHVGEGMIGSSDGPGWLARGLPVVRPE